MFELIEKKGRNREIDNYTIIRLNCNGASVDVKQIDGIVNDLWLYDNRIYYSLFTKMGGKNIESMDLNGEDVKVLVKKEMGYIFMFQTRKYTRFMKTRITNVNYIRWIWMVLINS